MSRAGPCGRWLTRSLGREHAAKSEMTGCAAYAMTLSSRRSVAMAVRRCAQVRTALHNSPVLLADVFCARRTACMNRRVARRHVVGRPRSGRPLPDIAGDVVEAVPIWRESLHRRCPVKAVGPKVLPRESAVPGVGHDATCRHELGAPGVGSAVQPATGGVLPLGLGRQHFSDPGCVRGCILITHMHDRVQIPPIKRAVRSVGVTPVCSWNPCPPPGPVVKRDGSLRANED